MGLDFQRNGNANTCLFGIVVVIYAVLFMNWDTKDTPFDGVSDSLFCSHCLIVKWTNEFIKDPRECFRWHQGCVLQSPASRSGEEGRREWWEWSSKVVRLR